MLKRLIVFQSLTILGQLSEREPIVAGPTPKNSMYPALKSIKYIETFWGKQSSVHDRPGQSDYKHSSMIFESIGASTTITITHLNCFGIESTVCNLGAV